MIKSIWNKSNSFIKFGFIGGVGFILELIIVNAWIIISDGGPLIANTVATCLIILFNWWANRNYNFEKTKKSKKLESVQFFIASILGLLISNALLWTSYYAMGYTELIHVNIVKIVGLVVASVVKFFLYKLWVFKN